MTLPDVSESKAVGRGAVPLVRMIEPPTSGDRSDLSREERVGAGLAEFLLGQQVVAKDCEVELDEKGLGRAALHLLRSSGSPIHVDVRSERRGDRLRCWLRCGGREIGPLEDGDYFRVDESGRIAARTGFRGLSRPSVESNSTPDHSQVHERPKPWYQQFKSAAARVPGLRVAYHAVRAQFFPSPPGDLSDIAGVTFRVGLSNPQQITLRCEDRGGFYDRYLNAEGVTYPAQVPGNYYCDAYSAQVLSWLFVRHGESRYADAAQLALEFAQRHYPQYAAAGIVWHHSDFKNAALLDCRRLLDEYANDKLPASLVPVELLERFVEDWYEPTNVHALRFHWRSARFALLGRMVDQAAARKAVQRVAADQTAEGLIHDNIAAYPDAHDLTYHQYSLACLAQGLAYWDEPLAREVFLKGAEFSLNLTTPRGEVAYVGRAANNIHHSASAVLTFHVAARLCGESTGLGRQFSRAAMLALEYLERHQRTDGMMPTAMNDQVSKRMGWNHCETPYNALVASLLLKSSMLRGHDPGGGNPRLPLECPGHVFIAPDSGYASTRGSGLYCVVFSGCDKSYAWSEGKHVTGVAGLALLGLDTGEALTPILDAPAEGHREPLSDLPVIDGQLPFGRGTLLAVPGWEQGIGYEHRYGGCELTRFYLLWEDRLLVLTRIRQLRPSTLRVRGLVSWPARCDGGWAFDPPRDGWLEVRGPNIQLTVRGLFCSGGHRGARSRPRRVSNPRGPAARCDLWDATLSRLGTELIACHEVTAVAAGAASPRPVTCELHGTRLTVECGAARYQMDTQTWMVTSEGGLA